MIKNTRQNSIAFNCLTAFFVLSAFFTSGLLQATGHKRESHLLEIKAVDADEFQSLLDKLSLPPQQEDEFLPPRPYTKLILSEPWQDELLLFTPVVGGYVFLGPAAGALLFAQYILPSCIFSVPGVCNLAVNYVCSNKLGLREQCRGVVSYAQWILNFRLK